MASQNANEIDEIIKKLKENQGFQACIILNHDGVVLRWENHVSKSSSTTSSGSIGPGIGGNSTISTNMTDESVPNFQGKHGGIYLTYEKAVHYAGHVLDLYNESQIVMNDLMQDEPRTTGASSDKGLESIRIRTDEYELISSREGSYILVVLYQ